MEKPCSLYSREWAAQERSLAEPEKNLVAAHCAVAYWRHLLGYTSFTIRWSGPGLAKLVKSHTQHVKIQARVMDLQVYDCTFVHEAAPCQRLLKSLLDLDGPPPAHDETTEVLIPPPKCKRELPALSGRVLRLYFDGGTEGLPNGGYAVWRPGEDAPCHGEGHIWPHLRTNNQCEVQALITGLEWLVANQSDFTCDCIEVKGDSKLIISFATKENCPK